MKPCEVITSFETYEECAQYLMKHDVNLLLKFLLMQTLSTFFCPFRPRVKLRRKRRRNDHILSRNILSKFFGNIPFYMMKNTVNLVPNFQAHMLGALLPVTWWWKVSDGKFLIYCGILVSWYLIQFKFRKRSPRNMESNSEICQFWCPVVRWFGKLC